MRTRAAGIVFAIGATWSLGASAQLQPPAPLQPQPGTWGAPQQQQPQPQAQWGAPPQQSATVQQLNAGESAGSFRRLELVYVNAEVGAGNAASGYNGPVADYGQAGLALGLGAGVRFLMFTVGVRGRLLPLSAFTFFEANLEAAFHLPLGAWDPYVGIHGGYAKFAMKDSLTGTAAGGPQAFPFTPSSPSGGDVGGSLGVDYYFTSLFSLGVDATLDALVMSTPITTTRIGATDVLLDRGGSSVGSLFMASAHAGFHFGL